jgi:hypothetical protein
LHAEQDVWTVVGPLFQSNVAVTVAETTIEGVDLTAIGDVIVTPVTVADGRVVVVAAFAPVNATNTGKVNTVKVCILVLLIQNLNTF